MNNQAEVKIGDTVIFTDEYRKDHNALVTAVWGKDCINLVRVSGDDAKTDPYGRQIERNTSVVRYSEANHYGMCFRAVGVEAVFPTEPIAR